MDSTNYNKSENHGRKINIPAQTERPSSNTWNFNRERGVFLNSAGRVFHRIGPTNLGDVSCTSGPGRTTKGDSPADLGDQAGISRIRQSFELSSPQAAKGLLNYYVDLELSPVASKQPLQAFKSSYMLAEVCPHLQSIASQQSFAPARLPHRGKTHPEELLCSLGQPLLSRPC